MSRTVAALYDSRAEAEFARARLVSRVKARTPRIIAKDTVGALDGLNIASNDKDSYRERLLSGGHLLVAEAPSGANAERIIQVLEEAVGHVDRRADQQWGDADRGVRVELPADPPPEASGETSSDGLRHSDDHPEPQIAADTGLDERVDPALDALREAGRAEHPSVPQPEKELRVGKRQVARGSARVRSFTHDAPAEEQVTLLDEVISVETRPCERRLEEKEVEAGGLFKERVFEVAEMREEPVVTKIAVVREEVIVRKRVHERTETIRDSVRRTEVEVEDLSESEPSAPTFFGERPERR